MPERKALAEVLAELADTLERAESLAHVASHAAFKENRLTHRVQALRDDVQRLVPTARNLASEAGRSE